MFIFVLAAAVASSAAFWQAPLARAVPMPFIPGGGPSVRVSPNSKIEIRWIADFIGTGKIEVFDNANSTGSPVDVVATPASTEHKATLIVGPLIKADTNYFFRITHTDPNGVRADLTNGPAPYPTFFTGAQTIGDVSVDVGMDHARILWDANVIGTGRVDYGIASPDELSVTDQQNVTSHSIELTGLAPGTTYQYRVCNRHAIDGDCLAAKTGSFTTLPSTPQVVQAIDDLRERVASYGLQRGPARSLDAKLEAALNAWQAGNSAGACSALSDFLNEVRAQTGKKLTEAQAQQLSAAANDIRTQIGC
jgi:hypothetical protein